MSCDGKYEDHETLYEFEDERIAEKKKIGQAFIPFAENPELQTLVIEEIEKEKVSEFMRITKPKAKIKEEAPEAVKKLEEIDFTEEVQKKPKQVPKNRAIHPGAESKYRETTPKQRPQKYAKKKLYSKPVAKKQVSRPKRRSNTPKRGLTPKTKHYRKPQTRVKREKSQSKPPAEDYELDSKFQALEEKFRKFKFRSKKN